MKKKITFNACFLFLLISSFISNAQDIKSIIDTNKIWAVMQYEFASGNADEYEHTNIIKIGKDTIIDSVHYNYLSNGFIREDSTGKIYYRELWNEYLLYDFNVETGDTINHYSTVESFNEEAYIGNIDSIMINGAYHKRIEILGCQEEYWIEGIGSTLGLIPVYCAYDMGTHLLCCHVDTQLIYSNKDFNSCYISTDQIKTYKATNTNMKVYPSIVDKSLKIKSPYNPVKIIIYNIQGKIEKEFLLYNTNIVLDCSFLSSGLYIVAFKEPGSYITLKTIKIIKQ